MPVNPQLQTQVNAIQTRIGTLAPSATVFDVIGF